MTWLARLVCMLARFPSFPTPPPPPPPPRRRRVSAYLYGIPCPARDERHARDLYQAANRTMMVRAICAANGRRYPIEGEA